MKRITILLKDELLDGSIGAICAVAEEVRIETLAAKPHRRKARAFVPGTPPSPVRGTGEVVYIMEHFTQDGIFNPKQAGAWVKAKGLKPQSAGPGLSMLKARGYISSPEHGKYKFERPLPGV